VKWFRRNRELRCALCGRGFTDAEKGYEARLTGYTDGDGRTLAWYHRECSIKAWGFDPELGEGQRPLDPS